MGGNGPVSLRASPVVRPIYVSKSIRLGRPMDTEMVEVRLGQGVYLLVLPIIKKITTGLAHPRPPDASPRSTRRASIAGAAEIAHPEAVQSPRRRLHARAS
jgi:hypothetical protein